MAPAVARPDRWRAHLPGTLSALIHQRRCSVFLALAAGSILYVIIELLAVGRPGWAPKHHLHLGSCWPGLLLGFATDAIVTAAGV